MLRQLLTLLAVLTGFALVAEPVQAAQLSEVSVAAAGDFDDCKTVSNPVLQAHPTVLTGETGLRPCRKPRVLVHTPTVMLRADRARE